jgi:hypothetical protein
MRKDNLNLFKVLVILGWGALQVSAHSQGSVSPNFGGTPMETPFYNSAYNLGAMGFTGTNFTSDNIYCPGYVNTVNSQLFSMGLGAGWTNSSCNQFADDYNIPQPGPTREAAAILRNLEDSKNRFVGEQGRSERDSLANDILERAKAGKFKGYVPTGIDPNVVNYGGALTGRGQTCRVFRDGDSSSPEMMGPSISDRDGLSPEEIERLTGELGNQPLWRPAGAESRVELTNPGNNIQLQEDSGYYMYNSGDNIVYGTPRTVYNVRAAGKLLAEQNIVMGVGDLSKRSGSTPGHSEHQEGQDVDLRLVGPTGSDGKARSDRCRVGNSSCYSRDNTFKMIKAFIDVDPFGIDKIFVNDSELQGMINTYLREAYSISQVNRNNVSRSCPGHSDHVHISFKRAANPTPDQMMEAANR